MKGRVVGELRLEEKELKINLGKGRFIFVGSSTDMLAEQVPIEWIRQVLDRCSLFKNTYLFQTKNPARIFDHRLSLAFPEETIFGTTIETNRELSISRIPVPRERVYWISKVMRTMVSIEPIMDFDLHVMIAWMKEINPLFVSIGADSKGHSLPEPTPEKVNALIEELSKFTDVRIKANLVRLRHA